MYIYELPSGSWIKVENAVVIGRHKGEIPGVVEVAERRNVQFPATRDECIPVLAEIAHAAKEAAGTYSGSQRELPAAATIIFQAAPPQVIAALGAAYGASRDSRTRRGTDEYEIICDTLWFAVVTVPGPRLAGETRKDTWETEENMLQALEIAKFANPNAKTDFQLHHSGGEHRSIVTVDPPMKFEFSHLEKIAGW